MTHKPLTPEEILASACNPADAGLYIIGPYNRRITFFSQQARALRLAHAMQTLDVVKPGQRTAVLGGGAAGATMAVALALLGKEVTLYDAAADILQLQSASDRLLHPHIYEWPKLGSLDDRAGLPVLDWLAGSADEVCVAVRADFRRLLSSLAQLQVAFGHKLARIASSPGGWRLSFKGGDALEDRQYAHVVLAMGFGDERPCGVAVPEDYWRPKSVGTAATEPEAGATYIVSGNGDGALTEALNLLVDRFEHVGFTRRFLGFFAGDELRMVAEQVFNGAPAGFDVEPDLRAKLLPTLSLHGVLDDLRRRLRRDRAVTLNSHGPLFAAGRAAPLNHCMACAVLEAARLEGIAVKRTSGLVSEVTGTAGALRLSGITADGKAVDVSYKHAIMRHGPDTDRRYGPAADLLSAYKSHLATLLAAHPDLAEPPALTPDCYDLFERLRIEKATEFALRPQLLNDAERRKRVIEVVEDAATHVVAERGDKTLLEVATKCELLPLRTTVHMHVPPSRIAEASNLVRLARCSGGRVELCAHSDVLAGWAELLPGIVPAPAPSSVRPARALHLAGVAANVDDSLMRALDDGLEQAVTSGKSPSIGMISKEVLVEVAATWSRWRAQLNAQSGLRYDFLRWLANVEQEAPRPWDGDRAALARLANAVLLAAAAHCSEALVPYSGTGGNLRFGAGAIALGTGCVGVGNEPLENFSEPDDWGADALILSASSEVEVRNPAGRVMDGGSRSTAIIAARRVSPAIIQNNRKWRAALAGDLEAWTAAVAEEFSAWRDRQDAELTGIPR